MGVFSMQHPAHHQQQGPQPAQLQHSRPSSVVHQQHHQQQAQPPPQQHQSAYSSSHTLAHQYPPNGQNSGGQDNLPSYYNHPNSYNTASANGGYPSADTNEMMAAAQMPRPPYPPMSYHTPQSNSPASVASPSQHDQHRSIYGQPPSQHMPQSMYYQPQPQYQSMPPQPTASPYAQHAQHPQQPMTSQPNMMMSHPAPHNPMSHQQHAQQGMTNSPRAKIESQVPLQLHKPQTSPMPPMHHAQNGGQLQSPGNPAAGVNPNAAPGPIPATTPPVVRQDGNGVQWIAFEYSRDRVKMEYTIRCDVESVNTEELSQEFKQENCVYPRACCPKDQYRGNRLGYETDCNRVGWALAHLNVPLRGKRGLIQRAVDSWRNSNSDPRLRSRRVRRMAKMNTRKHVQGTPHTSPMPAPGAQPGMPSGPAPMAPGGPTMGKPGLGSMGQPLHHHHPGSHPDGSQGGEEVDNGHYESHHHPGAAPTHGGPGDDVRQAQVFTGYANQGYPTNGHGGSMSHMAPHSSSIIPAKRHSRSGAEDHDDLFPDIPEAKKRKFILVEDNVRGSRLRVRVTLEGVDTNEIPDSFRKGASVFPRSYFPREMQSPPPSATGSHFFPDDVEDDNTQETEGREASRRGMKMVKVPVGEGREEEVSVPRTRRSARGTEVKLNDLGFRMAWLQSRVFSGRTVFLQRALDCYRNKTRTAIEGAQGDSKSIAPHYETRRGKARWNDRMKRGERKDD
ncbi:unnamed protein product [Clonostachys rhizophaga]|uniref:DUF8032 domain-containing protein n=1 Tax=Clonostachys rhizophaga TaxID=160324 RepID=A0A9N9V6Q4_9HYPO|nr:unnamed protein product [Clonostachys rhizophaga]